MENFTLIGKRLQIFFCTWCAMVATIINVNIIIALAVISYFKIARPSTLGRAAADNIIIMMTSIIIMVNTTDIIYLLRCGFD